MLEEEIVRLGAFKTGEFTLASGRKSDYYIDLRVAITKPAFLTKVAKAMSQHIGDCQRVAGVELGAVPIAAAISQESDIPYLMVRKDRKDHGAENLIEGELVPGDRVLFVEDTVTTAGSLIKAIQAVRELGGEVETAVVIVDRKEGAEQNLTSIDVKLFSLASIARLKELTET
jgi:orotate phosphoribosyltransferase